MLPFKKSAGAIIVLPSATKEDTSSLAYQISSSTTVSIISLIKMQDVVKQMGAFSKVICRVLANLFGRLGTDLLDFGYRMYGFCCCNKVGDQKEDIASCELIRETSEAFYKNVSRERAEILLENKQNGTFIIRPSKRSKLGTLSVVQDSKIFHLNIRRRDQDNCVALGREKTNEKTFNSINGLINYYISNYLILCSNGRKTFTLLLPYFEENLI
ncbi:unnamed protein product [Ceutorhynchus assimilis]|uniref:SH2 domain-containing protein n=1 Tax=Ceutorhynchus assimilis TaxID=467358 RepID=A0A9N9N3T2_9CUCU|nr:unnamed protein product [Ceutorhynchus assimilis]